MSFVLEAFEKVVLKEVRTKPICHYGAALVSKSTFKALLKDMMGLPRTRGPVSAAILKHVDYVTDFGPITIMPKNVPDGEVHMADIDEDRQPVVQKVLKLKLPHR